MKIYKVETYLTDDGRYITARIPNNPTDGDSPIFNGLITDPSAQGMVPMEFPFPPEYKNINHCFEDFIKVAQDYLEQMRREKKNRIIKPNELYKK